MDIRSIKPKLFEIIEPVALDAGFEVVDLALVTESIGWVLRVFIDGAGDQSQGVHIDDCARFSRELSAILDVDDPIPTAYNLEVSSPGIDRPLRTLKHFQAALGETVKIRLHDEVKGRRSFAGSVASCYGVQPNETVVLSVDGKSVTIAVDDIAAAKLVPDWDMLLSAKTSNSKTSGKAKAPNNKTLEKSAKRSKKNVSVESTKTHRPPNSQVSRDSSSDGGAPSQVK